MRTPEEPRTPKFVRRLLTKVVIISYLKVPERDQRYEQIDQNLGNTFSWAFETRSIGLSQWLREGKGIFWINGKPGSGKSTLMKFLLNDNRTQELLNHWRSKPGHIIAKFFFHHRGTHLQKSFEGLLGSLLSQLLEADTRLHRIVGEFLDEKSSDIYKDIQDDVDLFFRLFKIDSNSTILRKRMVTLLSENPLLEMDRLLREKIQDMTSEDRMLMRKTLLRDFDSLFHSIQQEKNRPMSVRMKMSERELHAIAEEDTCRKLTRQFPQHEHEIEHAIRVSYKILDVSSRIRTFLKESQLTALSLNYEQYIFRLVQRQKIHQKRQVKFHLMQWTLSDLEDGLRRVSNQDAFEVEVCLLFDALDEYAGSPDVISGFLKDLVKVVPTSKTQTKILFSSRPWTVFLDHFDTYPSICIHEHTMEDIREYCAGSLPQCSRTRALIRPLVGEIANRARGVFVWVKLVMTDLVTIVTKTDEVDDQLSQKLRQCLDSLPDELEEYYSTIIHRLPASTRRQSYILLECLSRSFGEVFLQEIPALLACGMSGSIYEAQAIIQSESAPGLADPEGHLRTISGGIIDIVYSGDPHKLRYSKETPESIRQRCRSLQFMHQTVKDWVELPTFKHTILGTRADMTWENGHSFLVKYYIYLVQSEGNVPRIPSSRILDHAVKAEMTTGVSQYMYLSRLPAAARLRLTSQNSHFLSNPGRSESTQTQGHRHMMTTQIDNVRSLDENIDQLSSAGISDSAGDTGDARKQPRVRGHQGKGRPLETSPMVLQHPTISGLHLAAFGGLSLYLADSVRYDKLVFRRSVDPLIYLLLETVRYKSVVQQADIVPVRLETTKLMLNNGFRIQQSPHTLPMIFEGIWNGADQQTAVMYTDILLTAAQNGLPPEIRFSGDCLDPGGHTTLLHLSPPSVAEYLLEKGADPNMLNGKGQTPLDYILEPESVFRKCAFGLGWLYDIIRLLVKNGAQKIQGTSHSHRRQDQELLQILNDNGYDINPLLSLQSEPPVMGENRLSKLDHGSGVTDVTAPETSAEQQKRGVIGGTVVERR